MRRSAAPSQASCGPKRTKFTAPAPVVRNPSPGVRRVSSAAFAFKTDQVQINDSSFQDVSNPTGRQSIFNNVLKSDDTNFSGNVSHKANKNPVSFQVPVAKETGYQNLNDNVNIAKNPLQVHCNGAVAGEIANRTAPRRDVSAALSLTSSTTTVPPLHNGTSVLDEDDNLCSLPTHEEESDLPPLPNTNVNAKGLNNKEISIPSLFKLPLSTAKCAIGSEEFCKPLEELESNNGSSLPLASDSHQTLDAPQITPVKNSPEETGARYFNVVWCKLSKKKHKKWEGDAVLSTKKRSATLYDMEGKIIGKGTGYKIAQLEDLGEDETLIVGGKEIQVMSLLKEEHFRSGKCFSAAGSCSEPSHSSISSSKTGASFKPFVNPVKHGMGLLPSQTQQNVCEQLLKSIMTLDEALPHPETSTTSRYDPTAPNALVMPRPSADHQWRYNKLGLPVLDVVVDPYLSHFLRDHQRHGVVFLYECIMGMRDFEGQGAILADDMGLGKTLQCISLIWTLLKQGPYGGKSIAKKVLIITPGSLVTNWYMEFKKWLGVERLNVYAASADKRVDEFVKTGVYPVMVISYEMLVRCFDTIKDVRFDLIVCDEGHRLKNTAIKTTSMISSLPTRKRIVLTGTPVQNDLQEFYSIVEFCNPGVLGSSGAFKRVYEDPIIASRQPKCSVAQKDLGKDRAEELTRLTQMFVLRRTQEINNQYLPPKVELVLFCRPSSLQLALYRQLICSQVIRRCLSGNLSGAPHLLCIGALKEVCNHPSLVFRKSLAVESSRGFGNEEDSIYANLLSLFPPTFDPNNACMEDSGKLEVLAGILTSIWQTSDHEKLVLVANHTKTLDVLQAFCEGRGYTCLRLDGQTPTTQRQQLVNKFNSRHNTTHRIFLLSSKAGGVGLNLIGASRLILYDIDWNPANDLQAMARVWRDGQKGKVHIYRLLTTGSIEEKIYQRQISKQGLSGAIMDVTNKNNVQFSVDDLKDLFSLNERTECETHSMLACDCQGDPTHSSTSKPQPPPSQDDRPCQLGQQNIGGKKSKGKTKNLTMAELLEWRHWQGQFAKEGCAWFLERVGSVLSFLFWHETNAQKTAAVE